MFLFKYQLKNFLPTSLFTRQLLKKSLIKYQVVARYKDEVVGSLLCFFERAAQGTYLPPPPTRKFSAAHILPKAWLYPRQIFLYRSN
jgi:hypothetical protein